MYQESEFDKNLIIYLKIIFFFLSQVPYCKTGYTMIESGLCSRTTQRCPSGSYSQNNRCVTMEENCPPGTTLNGNQCIVEEMTIKTVYETTYVDQIVSGTSCSSGICGPSPCTTSSCTQSSCANSNSCNYMVNK